MDKTITYLVGTINPCFFALDKELIFLDAGKTVIKLFGSRVIGNDFENIFDIKRPIRKSQINYAWIKKNSNNLFLLNDKSLSGPSLKGQFIELNNIFLFVGIPYLRKLEDLTNYNLLASDFPIFDSSVDFLILNDIDRVNFSELKSTHKQLKKAFKEIEGLKDQLELKLDEKTEQLDSMSLTMDEFAFSVGHDLKAPIRNISMFVQILSDRLSKLSISDEKVDMFSEYIVSSCNNALQLIDGLYSLTKLEQKEATLRVVSIKDLLELELENFKEAKDANFSIQIETDATELKTDPTLLKIIISNLVSNSVKFRKPDQAVNIEITAKVEPDEYVITVKDDGIGFDESRKNEAFEMFRRLSNSPDHPQGVGVGLKIVNSAVNKLKGKISVKSAINEGSSFSIKLPFLTQLPQASSF